MWMEGDVAGTRPRFRKRVFRQKSDGCRKANPPIGGKGGDTNIKKYAVKNFPNSNSKKFHLYKKGNVGFCYSSAKYVGSTRVFLLVASAYGSFSSSVKTNSNFCH